MWTRRRTGSRIKYREQRGTFALVAGLTIASSLATAQDLPSIDSRAYLSRGFPGESDELKISFAEAAEPRWVRLEEESSLNQILRQECGALSPTVSQALLKQALKLNGMSDANLAIGKGFVVPIPFCHKLEPRITVTVEEGENLEQILKRETGVFGPKSVRNTVSLTTGRNYHSLSEAEIQKFARELQVGEVLILSSGTSPRLFIPQPGKPSPTELLNQYALPTDYDPRAAMSTIQTPESFALTGRSGGGDSGGLSDRERFRSVEYPSPSVDSANANCHIPGGSSQPLFDRDLLMQRLTEERDRLEARGLTIGSSTVGVIDSGLQTVGEGIFNQRFFTANPLEYGFGRENVDDDRNGFVDDFWGMNFVENNGRLAHYGLGVNDSLDKIRSHGTPIAAVSLGGPDFIQNWPTDSPPLVKLAIVNYGSRVGNAIQSPDKFTDAITWIKARKASIVNMSMSVEEQLNNLYQTVLNNSNELLFVVAAGNRMSGGRNLDIDARYPAAYGGNKLKPGNIITVGAYNLQEKRSAMSNWGPSVDILAPGCAVQSIDHKGQNLTLVGSSFASAHVSFAAGLVRALGADSISPALIRRRLIASGDHDESLDEDDTWSKTRLNIIKAVSLTHDVIETRSTDQGAILKFGALEDVELLRAYCGDSEQRNYLDHIKKVQPNYQVNAIGNRKIKYWVNRDGKFTWVKCNQIRADIPITFTNSDTGTSELISIEDVVDITPAEFPAAHADMALNSQ